jgi:hypothetical protein
MVTKCANPSCNNLFHYLREGRLFLVEAPLASAPNTDYRERSHGSEYFWLCERCAHTMTITSDRNGRTIIAARTHSHLKSAVSGDSG